MADAVHRRSDGIPAGATRTPAPLRDEAAHPEPELSPKPKPEPHPVQAPLRQEEVAKQRLLNESLECPELLNDEAGEGADSSSESPEAERSPGTELKSRV